MKTQRITIEIHEDTEQDVFHWALYDGTGKPLTDSTRDGDKIAFSSFEGAFTRAAFVAKLHTC